MSGAHSENDSSGAAAQEPVTSYELTRHLTLPEADTISAAFGGALRPARLRLNAFINRRRILRRRDDVTLRKSDGQHLFGQSRVRTFVRKVEEALASGDAAAAQAALKAAQPELMRAAQRGVFHKRTASNKISRLAARVKKVG